MRSNSTYYPTSTKNLPPVLREKAIEIANALLEEGMEAANVRWSRPRLSPKNIDDRLGRNPRAALPTPTR